MKKKIENEKAKVKEKKIRNIYDKRNAFSLQQKEAVLFAFRISKLREYFKKTSYVTVFNRRSYC